MFANRHMKQCKQKPTLKLDTPLIFVYFLGKPFKFFRAHEYDVTVRDFFRRFLEQADERFYRPGRTCRGRYGRK